MGAGLLPEQYQHNTAQLAGMLKQDRVTRYFYQSDPPHPRRVRDQLLPGTRRHHDHWHQLGT